MGILSGIFGKDYFSYRTASKMRGPFALTLQKVSRLPDAPGVYLLGEANGNTVMVRYVGRAGSLRSRLANWIGQYSIFYFRELETEVGTFWTECRLFHTYGKANNLDNKIHPARPNMSLPHCGEIGCAGEAY